MIAKNQFDLNNFASQHYPIYLYINKFNSMVGEDVEQHLHATSKNWLLSTTHSSSLVTGDIILKWPAFLVVAVYTRLSTAVLLLLSCYSCLHCYQHLKNTKTLNT